MDRKSCLACSVPFIIFAGVLVAGVVLTVLALVTACRLGHTAMVERLVAAGADVNHHWWNHGSNPGAETPLSEAVRGRHLDIIELLERVGAKEW